MRGEGRQRGAGNQVIGILLLLVNAPCRCRHKQKSKCESCDPHPKHDTPPWLAEARESCRWPRAQISLGFPALADNIRSAAFPSKPKKFIAKQLLFWYNQFDSSHQLALPSADPGRRALRTAAVAVLGSQEGQKES